MSEEVSDSLIYSWMNPKLAVEETARYGAMYRRESSSAGAEDYGFVDGDGRAVYARAPLEKDEVLFVMGGHVLTIEDEDGLPDGLSDKPVELSAEFSLGPRSDADLPRMPQHYVNHSCDPNAGFDGQVFLVAMRDIKAGEEITYDYAMIMNSNPRSQTHFSFVCRCGSDRCRGVIAEDDWQFPDLQERYDGYFGHFLQKKINRLRSSGETRSES